jgi:hypothetical protein
VNGLAVTTRPATGAPDSTLQRCARDVHLQIRFDEHALDVLRPVVETAVRLDAVR